MCGLFLFIPNRVIAAVDVNVRQMEHRIKVPADKVWRIKFNKGINEDNLSENVVVYKPVGSKSEVKRSYDSINKTIIVEPPVGGYVPGQTYSLHIYDTIRDLNSNQLKEPVIMNFTIQASDKEPIPSTNREYNYQKYDKTLEQVVDVQRSASPVNVLTNYNLNPSDLDISAYLNPLNFKSYDYALYQFLTLDSYIEGITAEDLNVFLKENDIYGGGNGVLKGQGAAFIAAAKANNINVAYLVAHTILETGHGTSALSIGYEVSEVDGNAITPIKTYNMFGIGATDDNPTKNGSEYAYREGWFSPELAIMGGAKIISDKYINNDVRKQNTLYKMRWNPANVGSVATNQYATDIGWSYKIGSIVKQIQDKDQNANLKFEIPEYK